MSSLPLSGIRVVDFSRLIPGAFATLMLAELGADVIKVESPDGDPVRHLPPQVNGRGVYDLLLNRGKRSAVIDLARPESPDVVDRLVATADVVVESFRPAAARRFGVSGEQLAARHPRIVHCAITGYGQTGPYADRPGHDLNYVAVSGLLAVDRPNPQELPRMFIADVGGGAMSAVIGIVSALFARERQGTGASLDIAMHEAALYWVMLPAARDLVDGGREAAGELPTFGRNACYNIYRTKDDALIALGALEAKFWRPFCEAVGRPDLVARHASEAADQAELLDEVRTIFASRTRDEWLRLFEGHDVCLSPVNQPVDALTDPHIAARGAVVRAPGLRAVRPPFVSTEPRLDPAPEIGAHTADILASLGC